jgi:N-acetylmuramoyl-L-alanine amidase
MSNMPEHPHLSPLNPILKRRNFMALAAGAVLGLSTSFVLPEHLRAEDEQIPARKPKPPRLIMIDPGHGGKDPGAIGKHGTYEKDVTLDIARRIAGTLGQMNGVIVKLTRSTDIFIPLNERVSIARDAKADLFISIHADSAPTQAARGLSAYSLSEKGTDKFSRELAKRENAVDEIGGVNLKGADPDVASILRDLTARHTRNAALKAQKQIVQGMRGKWELLDNPLRAANFAVLRAPDIPSVLLETGFLSSVKDEALLRDADQRQKIANLLAREMGLLLSSAPFA